MTADPAPAPTAAHAHAKKRRWVMPVIFVLLVAMIVGLGLLAVSIMERRWEAQRPGLVLVPIENWETDNAKWGRNYPREWDSYQRMEDDTTRTRFGGSYPRDYLKEIPDMIVLFAGYGFSKEYRQARGHSYAVEDVRQTARTQTPSTAATCWTCKSPDVPRMMHKIGVEQFYASKFHSQEMQEGITHPIGCLDCHDPKTMNLRISRPALLEALAREGRDIRKVALPSLLDEMAKRVPEYKNNSKPIAHQEMRSLVCAQCHVEYYFQKNPKNYLKYPWDKGRSVEGMIEYYDAMEFADWTHPISKTPMLKAQHPDWELYLTGVHAYRNVSCSDCHMPYRTEGGVKFSDHHVQSPLLNVANSCGVCHRWSEDEIKSRVESIQDKLGAARASAQRALVRAHFDVGAGIEAGLAEAELQPVRTLIRHAQFRWDYVAASNGMGFHSPQESMRILLDATNQAQQARLTTARLLGTKGVHASPVYPDVSTKAKATDVTGKFVKGPAPKLLPAK